MKKDILLILLFVLAVTTVYGLLGSGTETNPYQISSLDDLLELQRNSNLWNKYFIQTADIDASSTSEMNNGAGFYTIGYWHICNADYYFSGSYNGNGNTISNLYINRLGNNCVGLFGYIWGATISNVGLINNDITGSSIVGSLVGSSNNFSTISNCYATGSVNGNGDSVGGLVGSSSATTINNCYTTGSVNGANGSSSVGGLVGNFSYTMTNCYATGSVNGTNGNRVGGLVGTASNSYTISKCYATGAVNGSSSVGGLVGYIHSGSGTIFNSFWDIGNTGQSTSCGGTGKTTQQMKDINTYLDGGWDFVGEETNGSGKIWNIFSSYNSGYPFFTYQPYLDSNIDEQVDFGIIYITNESDYSEIVLTNIGIGNLTIDNISCIDLAFNVVHNEIPVNIEPNSTFTIEVNFTPESIGIYVGELAITNNSSNEPDYILTLRGECQYLPPAPPENVQVTMLGHNANITWEAVTEDFNHNPLTPDFYAVYYNGLNNEDEELFFYHGTTTGLSYTHPNVGAFSEFMFYRVKAYVDVDNIILSMINELVSQKQQVSQSEIESMIKTINQKNKQTKKN